MEVDVLLKGQLHIHTTCSDGEMTPEEAAGVYRNLGFDFIAFTDHDHLLKPSYRQEIASVSTDLIVFFGIELTLLTRYGYVHVNRIEGDSKIIHTFNHPGDYGLTIAQTIECIGDVEKDFAIDAVEVTDHGSHTKEYDTPKIAYPRLATDDAHSRSGCGRAWITLNAARNRDSILDGIKKGSFANSYAKGNMSRTVIA